MQTNVGAVPRTARIILAAGGSGGHIFPAVALSEELEDLGNVVFFVASARRLDRNLLEGSKHKCFFLSANPMPRGFNPVKIAVFFYKLFCDVLASFVILLKTRPQVVVGFGGYSSGAISLMARLMFVPLLIHEQNFVPGRANKILGRLANRVAVSFKESEKYFSFPDKVAYTGNPLRHTLLLSAGREKALENLGLLSDKFTVLIMGGSQGSAFLNETASQAALKIAERLRNQVQFVHLAGAKDYEKIEGFYRKNGLAAKVFSFLEKMDDAYLASSLAVTRSGAAAVFELAAYKKPMILVPYPNPKNNQWTNARYFADRGAAIYKDEKKLSSDELADEVVSILTNKYKRDMLSDSAQALSVPDAARRLAEEVVKMGCSGHF